LETQAYQGDPGTPACTNHVPAKGVLVEPDPALGFYKGELRSWLGWTQQIAGDPWLPRKVGDRRASARVLPEGATENHILLGDLALTD
jgi:hypothetical protein